MSSARRTSCWNSRAAHGWLSFSRFSCAGASLAAGWVEAGRGVGWWRRRGESGCLEREPLCAAGRQRSALQPPTGHSLPQGAALATTAETKWEPPAAFPRQPTCRHVMTRAEPGATPAHCSFTSLQRQAGGSPAPRQANQQRGPPCVLHQQPGLTASASWPAPSRRRTCGRRWPAHDRSECLPLHAASDA